MSAAIVPVHPGRPPWLLRDGVWIYLSARDTAYLAERSVWRARLKREFRFKTYPALLRAFKNWQRRTASDYAAIGLEPPVALVAWIVAPVLRSKNRSAPPITADQIAAVLTMRAAGATFHTIADALSLSSASVHRILHSDPFRRPRERSQSETARRSAKHRERRRAGLVRPYTKPDSAACRAGHPRTKANSYVDPNGHVVCRVCRRKYSAPSLRAYLATLMATPVLGVEFRRLPGRRQAQFLAEFIGWLEARAGAEPVESRRNTGP